jgi:hypothetical protein
MFYDWLEVHQDFDFQLPLMGKRHFIAVDTATGADLGIKQEKFRHEGSFSTSISIHVSGNRITVKGNPSRINRQDNLFGFTTLDQCIAVYNQILTSYGLPNFTKCTKIYLLDQNSKKVSKSSDGAVITEVHITSNKCTGQGNPQPYIRALCTQPYKNSLPRLHTNGQTCDWLTKLGNGSRLIYPSVYNKGYEIELHSFAKAKRKYGDRSPEVKYLYTLINYCNFYGVVRFEQKLKSEFLRRNNLCFYGLFDEALFKPIHQEFLNIDSKLQVNAMSYESITDKLMREHICENTRSANVTTLYAIQWMHGKKFDFNKTQVQTHRARLRKIGIDIAIPCDLTKFSLVNVRFNTEINVSPILPIPDWYQRAQVNHLSLAA